MLMQKNTKTTVLALIAIVFVLVGIKVMQFSSMAQQGKNFTPPAMVVTSNTVDEKIWVSTLTAVGSLKAVEGVNVATEMAGKITQVAFEPGRRVRKGDLLLQQDISTEKTQLRSAQAAKKLAENNLKRSERLIKKNGISKSELDTAQSKYAEASAQVNNIESLIAKKTIRAPFSGQLGVKLVNVGQHLAAGEDIVTLQKLDPVFVNFYLPQRYLHRLKTGLPVEVNVDNQDILLTGKITAFNPEVDQQTRNILVQATVQNAENQVLPGMFVEATLIFPEKRHVLVVPSSAIAYAPYGNSVYIIESETDTNGNQIRKLRQQFVRTGETRGDFVEVMSGVETGQEIVSTGVFKLRNGAFVTVDNARSPVFEETTQPANS